MNDTSSETACCENTDVELWRERRGDYYSDSMHVTQEGAIGINVGGLVFVKSLKEWHRLAGQTWQLRDKYGWPVERVTGRPVLNFIRLLIHANLRRTWKQRHDYRPNICPQ